VPRDATSPIVETTEASKEVDYLCRRCGRLVSKARWRIAMNGDHEHVVFNPAGVVFRVLCFQEALSAEAVGEASDQFTWFRGFAWRIAVCRSCGGHLGWRYEGDGVFFGLIADSLQMK
jgi:hypothetical protein